MGQYYFVRPTAPSVPHHLHDDGDAVDGDVVEGIQYGILVALEVQAEFAEREPLIH